MVSVGKVVGLPSARHDVTDVDNLRLTLADGLTNLVNHHQVRQNAGKQLPGPKQSGQLLNRLNNLRNGLSMVTISII